jgi:photosystem II stability/assembly factor-like uncharacterized protein
MKNILLIIATGILCLSGPGFSQKRKENIKSSSGAEVKISYDSAILNGMEWRCIGPFRGGRSAAVTGVPGHPNLYYFGSTGGGVWKTVNGGQSWQNISDGYFGGSIGAVAVSESDPNVMYVGGGEKTLRGNVSYGYGVWKSLDGGETWKNIGLQNSRHISRIRIHPSNPDIVYAAVIGDIYKPGSERGVYRSANGGENWEKVLFANEHAGAVDLVLDPNNPRIMYASTWRVKRSPYSFESGGEGSALWKSTDSGVSWTNISSSEGLPEGTLGIIGMAVSPVNSKRIYAIIEAIDGGVFRSDDGGKNWIKVNDSRSLRQRAWYYSRIYADTKDQDILYVVNVAYHKSKDGGKTFEAYSAPHGDHHDLWIAPENNRRMIIGDDGGAQVTVDGGNNWSTYHNQPTAQFYRVTTDNHFPFRIYGAQQDNSTVRILHRSEEGSIGRYDWEPTAGGESAHIAVDPEDNDVVYGGSYGGFLTRVNHSSEQVRAVNVWPDNPMGYGAEGMKYRFQWNFPVFYSPHNPDKLYACSNHLHVSVDEGHSWEIISPDLTRNDSSKLVPSGGPITKDNTGVEYYCTIFAAVESQHDEGVLWTGSDDGLVHITRDTGANWTNVTPPDMPEWIMINSLEIDPFNAGGLYLAATMYKSGDYRPYLYRTKDYGITWQKITTGIDKEHFTRVVRADRDRPGLLYCGTESGMYISFDDGHSWHAWQLNLPIVPVTDLTLKDNSLIAATQGRSFWMIDDITPLHQISGETGKKDFFLFTPKPGYRIGGHQNKNIKTEGTNHPGGVLVNFYIKEEQDSTSVVKLVFLDRSDSVIRTFSTAAEKETDKLKIRKGFNQFAWDMRYPGAIGFEGMILWASDLKGPVALPGGYNVKLVFGKESERRDFTILKDPRSESTMEELMEQFDFLIETRDKFSHTSEVIRKIRNARKQLDFLISKLGDGRDEYKSLVDIADSIDKSVTEVERVLYQTRNQSNQDPLNYPIRLNNKLAHLMTLSSIGDYQPTEQALRFKEEVFKEIDAAISDFDTILTTLIPEFNRQVKEANIDAVKVE